MPRYYLHIRSAGKTITPDDEGIDLPDLEAVQAYAKRAAREIVDDMIAFGRVPGDERYVVMDEAGQVVFEYAFGSVRPN